MNSLSAPGNGECWQVNLQANMRLSTTSSRSCASNAQLPNTHRHIFHNMVLVCAPGC